jgi:hypothetical protein
MLGKIAIFMVYLSFTLVFMGCTSTTTIINHNSRVSERLRYLSIDSNPSQYEKGIIYYTFINEDGFGNELRRKQGIKLIFNNYGRNIFIEYDTTINSNVQKIESTYINANVTQSNVDTTLLLPKLILVPLLLDTSSFYYGEQYMYNSDSTVRGRILDKNKIKGFHSSGLFFNNLPIFLRIHYYGDGDISLYEDIKATKFELDGIDFFPDLLSKKKGEYHLR